MATNLLDIVQRLEKVVNHFEGLVGVPLTSNPVVPSSEAAKAPQASVSSPALQAYDSNILSKFQNIIATAALIDEQVSKLTLTIKEAYLFNRNVIEWAAGHKKPTEDEQKLIQGRLAESIKKIADLKDNRNPLNNFFLYSVEVIQATLWIISPMPGPTAESFIETSSFYGNKILVQRQENQVTWVKSLNELVRANVAYVKEFFLNGLIWNPNGKSVSEQLTSQPSKVEESKSAPKKPEETKVAPKKKEPKKLERGISWIFEYFENDKTIELPAEETGMKKAVMIDNCINCVVQIKGKVKSIVVSGCKNTCIVCQDVVSGIELINCTKMQVQSTGKVPSVTIDKTDGLQLYIPREGHEDVMFSSSKSTDMNIVMPGIKPDDDSLEIPIPHQYVHKIVNGKVTCAPSDLYSH